MLTSLDLLVILAMVLAASSLLAVCLMFLIRNRIFKQVCCCITAALTLYTSCMGMYIGMGFDAVQVFLGASTLLIALGAVVLTFVSRSNKKLQLVSCIAAAAALVVSLVNAFT